MSTVEPPMFLAITSPAFLTLHVVLSLIGIGTGLVALFLMLGPRRLDAWTDVFLLTTVLTSVTGFLLPFEKIGPPHIVGAISLVALAAALYARYGQHLAGFWRAVYVVGAVLSLYLNSFVGVVQAFQKISFLHALAPTQAEPPFAVAQLLLLIFFVAAGVMSFKRFHPPAA